MSEREQKLEDFAKLVAKSGRVWVASDVYEALLPLIKEGRLGDIKVERCEFLLEGEMLAVDSHLLNVMKDKVDLELAFG